MTTKETYELSEEEENKLNIEMHSWFFPLKEFINSLLKERSIRLYEKGKEEVLKELQKEKENSFNIWFRAAWGTIIPLEFKPK